MRSIFFCIFPKKKEKSHDVIALGLNREPFYLFTMLSQNQLTEQTLGNVLDFQTIYMPCLSIIRDNFNSEAKLCSFECQSVTITKKCIFFPLQFT